MSGAFNNSIHFRCLLGLQIENNKQVDAIQQRLLEKVDGVLAVHEFHVWQLAGDRIIASAHIRYAALLSRVDYVNYDLLF